jgi:hypothetical protein
MDCKADEENMIVPLNLLNVIEVQDIIKKLTKEENIIFNFIIACANEKINREGLLADELPDEVEDYFSPNLSEHSSDIDTDEEAEYAKDYADYKKRIDK